MFIIKGFYEVGHKVDLMIFCETLCVARAKWASPVAVGLVPFTVAIF